jgi:hypothetical protein
LQIKSPDLNIFCITTLFMAASLSCLNAHAGPQTESQLNQTRNISAVQSKLGPFIRKMATEGDFQSSTMVKVKNQKRVQVYIRLSSAEEPDINELKALNVEIEVVNTQLKKAQAWVEISQLAALSQLANVEEINTPSFAYSRAGGANTEGDAILKANLLRDLGFSGQGIRVGIVSDGSNDWTSARDSADLPSSLRRFGSCTTQPEIIESCQSERSCNEGTAMAEIIHDLAPSAELAVAAASTTLEFIQGINQLASVFKADIIVDDLGFYMEPYFEDGDVAKAVAALPSDILFISAAGNNGNNHYEADFKRFPTPNFEAHDFSSNDDKMGIIIPARSFVLAFLQWNEKFDAPSSDYDLFITTNTIILGSGTNDQSQTGSKAIEIACASNPSSTNLNLTQTFVQIRQENGLDKRLEMFLVGSPLIEFPVPEGSIFGHSGLTRTLSVAAINAVETGNDDIATYSSRGPSRIDFPNQQNRPKPDLTAIDGVTVSGAGGFSTTFFGTSAAAPHVAGIAAQLMSSSDRANAKTVHKALTRGALDLGPSGFDSTYGFGLVDAILANAKLNQSNPIGPIMLLLGDDED